MNCEAIKKILYDVIDTRLQVNVYIFSNCKPVPAYTKKEECKNLEEFSKNIERIRKNMLLLYKQCTNNTQTK